MTLGLNIPERWRHKYGGDHLTGVKLLVKLLVKPMDYLPRLQRD